MYEMCILYSKYTEYYNLDEDQMTEQEFLQCL
jgi:hypothetical protein